MKNQDQNNNEFKKKAELKGFHDLKKLDEFIQFSLEKFKLVDPMKKLYDATKNDANSIISHKSTIPDLVIWNKTFNKNECFCDADINEKNPFPRFQFFLRIKGPKNDKDKKNNKEKNKNKKFKKKDINENDKKEKSKKKENESKNLNQLLNNNNQNEMNKIVSKMKEIGINGDIKDSERIIPQDLEYLDDFPKKNEKKKEQEKEYEYDTFNEMNLNKIFNDKEDLDDNQDNKEYNLEQMNPINNFKISKNDFFNDNNDEKQIFNSQINTNNDYNNNNNNDNNEYNYNNNFNNLNEINPLLRGKEDDESLNINQFQNQFDDKKQKKKNTIKKKKIQKSQILNQPNNNNMNNNLNNNNFMLNNNNLFMQGMQNNYFNQNQNQGNRNINLQQFMQNEYLLNLVAMNYNRKGWLILNNERKIFGIYSSYDLFQYLSQHLQTYNLSYIFIRDIDTSSIFNGFQMYFILSQTLPIIIQTSRQLLIKNNMNNMNIKQNTIPFSFNQNMNNNVISLSNQQNQPQTKIDQFFNDIDMK